MTYQLPQPPEAWKHLPFFKPDGASGRVSAALRNLSDADRTKLCPPAPQLYAALEATSPASTKVVILGQDPYPTRGHANGLAFSVAAGVRPLPRSLANIFRELTDDVGAAPLDGDLTFWARQGVLLLNTSLSVIEGKPGSLSQVGWSDLTRDVLQALSSHPRVYILWGKHAEGFADTLTHPDNLILVSAHPSPLSARRGFFGSRPFSRANLWLKANRNTPINWTHP